MGTETLETVEAGEQTGEQTEPAALPLGWRGIIGMEGELTGDGRLIETNALTWDTPVPLRFVLQDSGAHDGAITVGRILDIQREDGGELAAFGDFDLGSEHGREAARLVAAEVLNGVSMDLDTVAFEIRVAREVYDEMQGLLSDAPSEDDDSELAAEPETDDEGRVKMFGGKPDDEVMVTQSARVRAATIVAIPAFKDAKIEAVYEFTPSDKALVASAAPVEPPSEWFEKLEPSGPTPLTITDEGQVYGHLATWDQCHVGEPGGPGVCVNAPRSASGYSYFHVGTVKTAEGSLVPTGVIRFSAKHAAPNASAAAARAHYDNTALAGADVHATDGKHGVWVCGALRPGLTDEQVRELRAAPLSGDWRTIGGSLELVGALAVNVPGFPVARPSGMVASGELMTLVAAGSLPKTGTVSEALSEEDRRALRAVLDEQKARERAALAARVQAAKAKNRVSGFRAQRATRKVAR